MFLQFESVTTRENCNYLSLNLIVGLCFSHYCVRIQNVQLILNSNYVGSSIDLFFFDLSSFGLHQLKLKYNRPNWRWNLVFCGCGMGNKHLLFLICFPPSNFLFKLILIFATNNFFVFILMSYSISACWPFWFLYFSLVIKKIL